MAGKEIMNFIYKEQHLESTFPYYGYLSYALGRLWLKGVIFRPLNRPTRLGFVVS